VVYEALLDSDKKLDPKKPLDAYWLNLEPEYQAALRKKGEKSDREDLNMLENNYAYGLTAVETKEKGSFKVTLVAFGDRPLTLLLDSKGVAHAVIKIDGVDCDLQRIYVNSIERTLRLPKVEYVELFGLKREDGSAAYEKLVYKD